MPPLPTADCRAPLPDALLPPRFMGQACGISVLTQSGPLGETALTWMASRGLGLARLICTEDEAGLSDALCLSLLAQHPETKIIAYYLEGVSDGAGLLAAIQEAARHKPVIVLTAETEGWYRQGADQETRRRMPSPEVFNAACDRMGALRASHLQEWLDTMLTLARTPLPAGNRVALIATGTTPANLTLKALGDHGLHTATVMDPGWSAGPAGLRAAVATAAANPDTDALLMVVTLPMPGPLDPAALLCPVVALKKPVCAVLLGGEAAQSGLRALDQAGIAGFPTPERAAAAMALLEARGAASRCQPRVITPLPVDRAGAEERIRLALHTGQRHLTDFEARPILAAYGIAVPAGERVASADAALEAATRLGYPVALHLLSPDSRQARGLITRYPRLTSPAELRDACDLLTLRFARRVPAGRMDGLFVEQAIAQKELLLMGMQRDEQFGPLLHVESADPGSLRDARRQLAPITAGEAMAMLAAGCPETRQDAWPALAEILQRLGQLACDFPEIARIMITPLVVRPGGLAPVATECSMLLAPPRGPCG
ncbi:MAG: acetate--CoA ligase family protein [Magnetococcales bacterium]|nr:acetate--CoA ligase family protein [Magnetococcales bacterium]